MLSGCLLRLLLGWIELFPLLYTSDAFLELDSPPNSYVFPFVNFFILELYKFFLCLDTLLFEFLFQRFQFILQQKRVKIIIRKLRWVRGLHGLREYFAWIIVVEGFRVAFEGSGCFVHLFLLFLLGDLFPKQLKLLFLFHVRKRRTSLEDYYWRIVGALGLGFFIDVRIVRFSIL